jgi:multidrug resistance efflux pump
MRQYILSFARALGLCCCLLALGQSAALAGNDEPIFSGKAYAQDRAELRTFGSGKITEVNVGIGQFVKGNSTLLSFEGDDKRLAEFKERLSLAKVYKLEWKRQQILRTLNSTLREANLYGTQIREDMATTSQINDVNISISSLEKQLDAVDENISDAKDAVRAEQLLAWYALGIRNARSQDVKRLLRIHSPIPGNILWVNPDFHVGAEMRNDVKSFIIGDMSHVKLVCEAYEASVKNIKEGQKVNVRFDAIENKVYSGIVSSTQWASANAEDKSKPSLFGVEIAIDNSKLEIKEGYVGHVYLAE